jgi:hypothetical protein
MITTRNGKRILGSLFQKWITNCKLPEVKTFENGDFTWKPISNIMYVGKKEIFELKLSNKKIICGDDSYYLTDNGYVKLNNLNNDLIISDHPEEIQISKSFSNDCEQIFLGSFLGDGSIEMFKNKIGRVGVTHCLAQEDYCKWKADMFHSTTSYFTGGFKKDNKLIKFVSKTYGLKGSFPRPKTNCPQFVIDNIDERAIAIWFMDDGSTYKEYNGASFHTESFDNDTIHRLILKLKQFDIDSKKLFSKGNIIRLSKDNYYKLSNLIAPFIHNDLMYKIHPDHKYKNNYIWNNTEDNFGFVESGELKSLNKEEHLFTMSIKDNNNFLIPSISRGKKGGHGGVVVKGD